MAEHDRDPQAIARAYAATASAALEDNANFVDDLGSDDWSGPTGCADWDMKYLEGHILGEGVWFAHLALEVGKGEEPLLPDTWEQLANLPNDQISSRLRTAARELTANVESASPEELQREADLQFVKLPLHDALFVGIMETVFHNWDAHVGRDPNATIPTPWALQIAAEFHTLAPMFAHSDGLADSTGNYLLNVGDGVGPMTVQVTDDGATVTPGDRGDAGITIGLSADGYVRLLAGRYPLSAAIERGDATAQGDMGMIDNLNRVFGGIAN